MLCQATRYGSIIVMNALYKVVDSNQKYGDIEKRYQTMLFYFPQIRNTYDENCFLKL